MEAQRFVFDPSLPPAFKFDPTDADLVAHYLLPRALNIHNPHAHAVIDGDPGSCPPWELMRRHGHDGSKHAFFFVPTRDPTKNGGRTNRVFRAGGTWRGQKGEDEELFLVRGGAEIRFKYKKYNLTYYREGGGRTTGWVMHEYEITEPPLPETVLSRIKITNRAEKLQKEQELEEQAAAAAIVQQGVTNQQEQPGPSNYYVGDGYFAGNAVVVNDGEGTSGGAQAEVVMGEPAGHYTDLLNARVVDGGYGVDDNSNNHFDEGYLNQGAGAGYFFLADYDGNGG